MHGLEERLIGRWPRLALNLLTVSVVAYFLASGAVSLMLPPVLPGTTGVGGKGANGAASVTVPPLNFFGPILTRNAFKAAVPKPKAKPKPKQKGLGQLSVAKIKSRLLGTMYSDVSELSRAVILKGNRQQLIKIGQPLEGFKVADIQRRAIVLQKGGQRQLLLIDVADKKTVGKASTGRKMLPRKELKSKLQDLDALSRDIKLAPATRGKAKGLWVQQLRAGSVFNRAGLQKDDVILKVGGQSVVGGANPLSMFKMLDREQVAVDILRNNRPMQLVVILTGN